MPCQHQNFKKRKKNSQILKKKKNLIFLFFSFLCRSCSFLTKKHSKTEFSFYFPLIKITPQKIPSNPTMLILT